ncbi:MAG: hypothetical protein QSU88_09430, partial [Candidatus Methanoperedens sp.]|nr:hypothetical protein [Candidatus Methanoperedens sp.]
RRLGRARRQLQGQLVAIHPRPPLILRYTAPGELVLDLIMGSGTTHVGCKLLGLRDARSLDLTGSEAIDLIAILLMSASSLIPIP